VDLPKTEEPKTQLQAEEPTWQRNFQSWMDFLFHRQSTE